MAINSTEFTGRVPHFFDLLSRQDISLPNQSQWVMEFSTIPSALINQISQYESFQTTSSASIGNWNINGSVALATDRTLQNDKGCIFAQSVVMPAEGTATERVGEYMGAYVKGIVTTKRNEFENFSVSFLETNLSFADMVLRPWTIMAAHKSLIARPTDLVAGASGNSSIKANIQIYHLAKAGYGIAPIIRKQFSFYDCVPVSIDTEEYNYGDGKVIQRQINFVYSYYTLQAPNQGFSSNTFSNDSTIFEGKVVEPIFEGTVVRT